MGWPGAIYDGAAPLDNYRTRIKTAAGDLGMSVVIRPDPIYSTAEADASVPESRSGKPDGLLVVLLDRQEHAWPTAAKAVGSGDPQ